MAKAPVGKRPEQVRAVKALVAEARGAEIAKVAQDLQALGIDWTDAPADVATAPAAGAAQPPAVEVKVETDRPGNEAVPGEPMALRLTVTNKGKDTLYGLAAMTEKPNPMFDNKELVVGKLEPGKSRTVTAPLAGARPRARSSAARCRSRKDAPRVCRVPRDALSRTDGIRVPVTTARGRVPPPAEVRVGVKGLDRPVFAYSYRNHLEQTGKGNRATVASRRAKTSPCT